MAKRKRRHGSPDPFHYFAVDAQPASEDEARKALEFVIERFVATTRRERASHMPLDPKKRERAIRELSSWLDPAKTTNLDGSAGFPQHLAARFGALPGTYVGANTAVHVTVPEAATLARDDSLFVSADGAVALLFYEVGHPTLCLASKKR